MTATADPIATLSVREIVDAYARKALSPVEVARSCVEAVTRQEPRLHAWACFDPDKVVAQARESERRIALGHARSLDGVPIGVKDIFNTADFTTEMGSRLWKGYTPGNDARAVYSLRQAGSVIPGKTATAEFAVHELGDTVNPHHPSRTPGTSSSGSAVAVAASMVPVALGTQTGGSIVRPASYCGVYGFKPSFGLIPRTGTLKTTDSLDTVGFLCRHLDDLEPVLEVLRVRGQNFPLSNAALSDSERQSAPRARPWRVALTRTHTWSAAQEYAKGALLEWSMRLAASPGVEVSEVDLPQPLPGIHAVHATIYDKTLAYYFSEEFKQPGLMSTVMRDIVARGSVIGKEQYVRALEEQSAMAGVMDRFFADYDIVVSLSTAGAAPLRDEAEPPDPALIWTTCHMPAISVPAFASPDGLPFGVQVAARRYNDLLLLRFLDALRQCGLAPVRAFPAAGA